VVWAGIVTLPFPTDVHGSQKRAKNTALDTGLENWQNFHFLEEKVTRKSNMLVFRCLPQFRGCVFRPDCKEKSIEYQYFVRLDSGVQHNNAYAAALSAGCGDVLL
jgi:hypothetical protein